jgi:hypothetical protein
VNRSLSSPSDRARPLCSRSAARSSHRRFGHYCGSCIVRTGSSRIRCCGAGWWRAGCRALRAPTPDLRLVWQRSEKSCGRRWRPCKHPPGTRRDSGRCVDLPGSGAVARSRRPGPRATLQHLPPAPVGRAQSRHRDLVGTRATRLSPMCREPVDSCALSLSKGTPARPDCYVPAGTFLELERQLDDQCERCCSQRLLTEKCQCRSVRFPYLVEFSGEGQTCRS